MIVLLLACSEPPPPPAEPAAEEAPRLSLPPPGTPTLSDRLEPLQGRWRSVEDSRAEVLIIKTLWVEGYDGEERSRAALEWADGCRADGGRPSPTGTTLNLLTQPPRCMRVESITEDALTLTRLPQGTPLRLVRAPADGM